MTSSRWHALGIVICAAVVLVASVAWSQHWFASTSPLPVEQVPAPLPDAEFPPIPVRADSEAPYRPYEYQLSTDEAIAAFEKCDPTHLNLTTLGCLHLRKARECGGHAPYEKAEDAFRRALAAMPKHLPARVGLAIAACARHRFAEGLALAEAVYRDEPSALEALMVIADAHLELGNYGEAEVRVKELERKSEQPTPPAVLARKARLAELRGQTDEAVKLWQSAVEAERVAHDFPQFRAWYPMRLGEVLLGQGKLDEAISFLEESLRDHPTYPAALTLLGRARTAQGRDVEARELYYRAIRITPDLATLIVLADSHQKAGEEFLAKTHYAEVEKADRDGEVSRDLVLYYCDHDRRLPRALELAERDLKTRKDVYAYDVLAWALFKNRRLVEAEKAMTEALKLGTRDAAMLFHAGMIQHGLGNRDKARDFLERSLAANPHFSPTLVEEARRTLARLDGLAE